MLSWTTINVLLLTVISSATSSGAKQDLDDRLEQLLHVGDEYRLLWLSFVESIPGPDNDFFEKKRRVLQRASEIHARLTETHKRLLLLTVSLADSVPLATLNRFETLNYTILNEAYNDSLDLVYTLTTDHDIPWSIPEFKSEVFYPTAALALHLMHYPAPLTHLHVRHSWLKRSLFAAAILSGLTAIAYRYKPLRQWVIRNSFKKTSVQTALDLLRG